MKKNFGIGASIFCIASTLVATPAVAQTAQTTDQEIASESTDSREIVVTARRRAETLLSVPVAITALDVRELERRDVSDLGDLMASTPSLVFEGTAGNSSDARIFIRGVGNANPANDQDPGVGIYIDGVYFGRSGGGFFDNVDIAQIEVLRGPQGTLFGRNTIGGAISITTQAPNDELSGSIAAGYGNYDEFSGRASINVPIVPGLIAARASASYQKNDGYSVNVVDGRQHDNKDKLGFSGGLRITPSHNLTIDFRGMYIRDNANGRSFQCAVLPGSTNPLNPLIGLVFGTTVEQACVDSASNGPRDFASDIKTLAHTRVLALSNTIDLSLGELGPFTETSIKNITGLIKQKSIRNIDFDGTSLNLINSSDVGGLKTNTFSNELQFSGEIDNKFNIVIGAYYSHEKTPSSSGYRYTDIYPFLDSFVGVIPGIGNPLNLYQRNLLDTKSFAIYSQATYDLSEVVSLTAGIRYTKEKKQIDLLKYYVYAANPTVPVPFSAGGQTYNTLVDNTFNRNFSNVSPMASIQFNLPDSALGDGIDSGMLYFSYAKGFKSGGFNGNGDVVAGNISQFNPENVNSFEVGLKGSALDRRLRLSLAAYLTKYNQIQLAVVTVNASGVPTSAIENAARATIKGFEGEAVAMLTSTLRFDGSFSYTDPQFKEYFDTNSAGMPIDRSNEPFAYISKWTYTAGIENAFDLGSLGTITPRVEITGRSKRFLRSTPNAAQRATFLEDPFTLLNAQIRWAVNPDLIITAYGKNLTNKLYRNDALAAGSNLFYYAEPRTYGIKVQKTF